MTSSSPTFPPHLTGLALLDATGCIRSYDAALAQMLGEALAGQCFVEALPIDEDMRRKVSKILAQVLQSKPLAPAPAHWQHPEAEYQLTFVPMHDANAQMSVSVLVQRASIQDRENHHQTLRSLHTLHEAIIRLLSESDRRALIRALCKVLVKSGGYPLIWIACVDDGRIEHMESLATKPGFLDELTNHGDKETLFEGIVEQALSKGHPSIQHHGDESHLPAERTAIAEAYGYRSSAAFPVSIEHNTRGVLVVYSDRPLAFKGSEYDTLRYLAEGLAYALTRLEQRHSQQLTEDKLRQATTLFEASREGQLITDEHARIIAANPALSELTGYSIDELLGERPTLFRSGHHNGSYYATMWNCIKAQGYWQGEIWNRCKDGSIRPYWLHIGLVPSTPDAPVRYVGTYTDITTLKEIEARLEHLAHHDALTDLPNRTLLESRLNQALKRADRHKKQVALLFLDLDGFKRINDSLGHSAGDRVLIDIAVRLSHAIREEDVLARFGGDEFVVLIENLHQPEQASLIARQLLKTIAQSLELDGQTINLSASIGIAVAPNHGQESHELIQNADTAMYRAKASGRNTYQYYTRELTVRTRRQLALENNLRNALKRDEFHLQYQPLISMRDSHIAGVEALLRWERENGESIPPDEFIPLAEERGLIVPIGSWVLEQACAQAVAWGKSDIGPLRIAVNVSGRQLDHRGFAREIDDLLLRSHLKPETLELEVTETLLMEHEAAAGIFDYLNQLGLRLAIDDFGTGYSSLSRLTQLRPSTIKIDRSFVQAVPYQSDAAAITTAIVHMAHSLGMEVVAEGVETTAQLDFLRSRAVDLIQGYYYTPPLKAKEFENWARAYCPDIQ